MRRGRAADSRGAPKFVSEALATAVETGCTGTRILRADSQFYNAGVIAACRRAGAHFSITCGMNPSIKRAVLSIPDQAWQQITYPTAVPDPATALRATGAQASAFHARATTATIRTHLVHVPARIARSARRITLHLPHNRPWQHAWTHLSSTAHGPAD